MWSVFAKELLAGRLVFKRLLKNVVADVGEGNRMFGEGCRGLCTVHDDVVHADDDIVETFCNDVVVLGNARSRRGRVHSR